MRAFDPNPPPAVTERRNYVRVPFLHPITIALSPDGRPIDASSIDISLGGVGLSSRGSFQKGDVVIVTFRVKDPRLGFVSEHVSGRIVNFVADFDENRIGVEFLEPLQAVKRTLRSRGRLESSEPAAYPSLMILFFS